MPRSPGPSNKAAIVASIRRDLWVTVLRLSMPRIPGWLVAAVKVSSSKIPSADAIESAAVQWLRLGIQHHLMCLKRRSAVSVDMGVHVCECYLSCERPAAGLLHTTSTTA